MARDVQGGGIVGLLFGLVIGAWVGYQFEFLGESLVTSVLVGAGVVGALGYFYGDRLWRWIDFP